MWRFDHCDTSKNKATACFMLPIQSKLQGNTVYNQRAKFVSAQSQDWWSNGN